jgi:hypothetical protein
MKALSCLFARNARLVPVLLACLGLLSPDASAARLQRWLYYPVNLSVNSNIPPLQSVFTRAAAQGYTHILISDFKSAFLQNMNSNYFNNVNTVKSIAASLDLELVPAVFSIGYSNDLLFNDPNLIEALPVTDTLLVVSNGVAVVQPDPPVSFRGGDFSNLALWDWKDSNVVEDNGTARVTDPNGANARIVQGITVTPFRQYHISVRVKTQSFMGTPEVKVLAPGNYQLNYNYLGVQQTQDWNTHHVVFNSLTNTHVTVYFGCWGGTTGSLWWDDTSIEELAFLNIVRRPGAPLTVRVEGGRQLIEGTDFPAFKDSQMGVIPWNGTYDVYHTPPVMTMTGVSNGTRLRASWYHAVTVYDDQAMICPSEPATTNLLWNEARRMTAAWGAKGYMMSHDEIRVFNWCAACRQRNMDAGEMLADNVRTCINILRTVNPGGDIYVWSDMFDPNHNAHDNYYLVRGNLTNSWLGLDSDVIISPWAHDLRQATMSFFADRGNRQVMAGYYDQGPNQITDWLNTSKQFPGALGVMYTTWISNYNDIEAFAGVVSDFEIHNSWQLGAKWQASGLWLEMPTMSGHSYTIMRSNDLTSNWQTWTNFTSGAAIARCVDTTATNSNPSRAFYQSRTLP